MHKCIEEFLKKEKIDVFGEVSAENLKIILPRLMPENIRSACVWLIPYYTGAHPNRNVSLYAVSRDYHFYSKQLGERMTEEMKKHFPQEEFYVFCDSSPISEVSAAISAGLGVLGRNRLLINEKYGSYVFIGCMLSTLEPENPHNEPLRRCVGCGNCERACDFLGGRSETCISELNQRKVLDVGELDLIRSRKIRWGCDICQEVCPYNRNLPETPIDFFYGEQIENITPELIENMSKDEFKKRAYAWRGKKTILRNVSDSENENQNQ